MSRSVSIPVRVIRDEPDRVPQPEPVVQRTDAVDVAPEPAPDIAAAHARPIEDPTLRGTEPAAPAPEPCARMEPEAEADDTKASRDRKPEAACDASLDLARCTRAEFAGYRKRIERERAADRREAVVAFLQGFLPAFDDLERALGGGREEGGAENVLDGVALARDNLWKAMADAGVERVPDVGARFDPAVHEAMGTVPANGKPAGTVVEVCQPGFRLGERLIRPARVLVAAEADEGA